MGPKENPILQSENNWSIAHQKFFSNLFNKILLPFPITKLSTLSLHMQKAFGSNLKGQRTSGLAVCQ